MKNLEKIIKTFLLLPTLMTLSKGCINKRSQIFSKNISVQKQQILKSPQRVEEYFALRDSIDVNFFLYNKRVKEEVSFKNPNLNYLLNRRYPDSVERTILEMSAYMAAKTKHEGFWRWVDRLKQGSEKERRKAELYEKKNPREFNEEYVNRAIFTILNNRRPSVIEPRIVISQSLLESILGALSYGALDEIGLFHGRPCVEIKNAIKLKLKGNIEELLLNPETALLLYNEHMRYLIKNENPVEIFGRYNAGKYWKKFGPNYLEMIKYNIKTLTIFELMAKTNPELFCRYYLSIVQNKKDLVSYDEVIRFIHNLNHGEFIHKKRIETVLYNLN